MTPKDITQAELDEWFERSGYYLDAVLIKGITWGENIEPVRTPESLKEIQSMNWEELNSMLKPSGLTQTYKVSHQCGKNRLLGSFAKLHIKDPIEEEPKAKPKPYLKHDYTKNQRGPLKRRK